MTAPILDNEVLSHLQSMGIEPDTSESIYQLFKKILESTISHVLETESVSQSPGTKVTRSDQISAAELRVALISGKLPKDAGLLIDTNTTAKLLGISSRHFLRLHDKKEVPEAVRLGGSIRWRLTEILEWLDADCPTQKIWKSMNRKGRR